MTSQRHARALSDPTRHRIFELISTADRPLAVDELTALVGVHHNSVRQHLAQLIDARLVDVETMPPVGRGRPRLRYVLRPQRGRESGSGPYERLSALLTETVSRGRSARETGYQAGRRRRVVTDTAPGVAETVAAAMAEEGFEPELVDSGRGFDVVLRACPFTSSVLVDPDVICELHRGLADGLTDGTALRVVELTRGDPRRAGCVLRLGPAATTGEQTPVPRAG